MMCDSKELLVGYLYDELDGAERRAFETHLLGCAECRSELPGLKATRSRMVSWAPPAPDLEFRIVRGAGTPAPARARFAPAWGLAAAAVLVLAAGAALANVEVRYGNDGVVVRTGWGRVDPQGAQAPGSSSTPQIVPAAASPEIAGLERRLRDLEGAMQRAAATTTAAPASGGVQAVSANLNDAELMKRVRQMITEAESRQQTELALQLAQVFKDFDRLRRADLALIQQGLGQYQGVTNAEIAQQRDMLNQFIRVASRQEK